MGKTALILEPFQSTLFKDFYKSVGLDLANKGYAVTDYADSGVTWQKVNQLDEHTISLINTHGLESSTGDTLGLTISSGATEADRQRLWTKLQEGLTNENHINELLIIDGCSAFKTNADGTTPGKDAVKNSYVSGGFSYDISSLTNGWKMDTFFQNLCSGDSVEKANIAYEFGKPSYIMNQMQGKGYPDYKLGSNPIWGSSWNVNPGEQIQDYIKKAMSGDTITISPGIFNENLVINKPITLQGAGKGSDGTIVDGQDSGSVIRVINDKGIPDPAIEVNLFDLLIRNGLNFQGGGIYNLDNLNIEDCTISGNDAKVGGGIFSAGTVTIKNSDISENEATKDSDGSVGNGGGIFNDGGVITITDSTIFKNKAANDGGGVYSGFSSHTTYGGTTQIIDNEATTGYGGGIYSDSFDTYDGTGVAVKSNKAHLPDTTDGTQWYQQYGVYGVLPNPTNGFDPATEVTDNTRILNLYEWSVNAGELIQSYIDKATSGDTITISPGIFNENLVIDKSLTLKGSGNTESGTVVKGLGTDSVFTIGKVDPNIDVKLCDMLIRNGKGTLDPSGSYDLGGGISNEGSLTVNHCTITNNGYARGNWASGPWMYGGGIYSSGDLTVISSTISGNYANAGAGIYLDNHGISPSELKAEITDGIISANSGANGGGGIYNNRGYLTLTGSEITGNGADYYGTGGGGIANMNRGIIEMVSGTISGNSAFDGSGVKNYGTFTMKGGSISHNKAFNAPAGIWATSSGGGVHNSGTFNLEGGSISGNYAYSGGGVYNYGTFNLKSGSINSNVYDASDGSHRVPYKGGGIYNSGTLSIEGGSISNNTAYNDGGGIYNSGTIYPDYSKCSFGTGADANSPNDHN